MSLALNPLEPVRVMDPRVNFSSQREYAVLTGGEQVSWKPYMSTSYSNSAWNFSAPPPSPLICVDPKVYVTVPVQINFTGTTTNPSNTILNNGFDALRAFPLSQIIQTLTVRLNNSAASINLSDVIGAILRYNTPQKIKEFDFSGCPTMQDYYQNYSDGTGTVRNPLDNFGSNSWETTRGGFPYCTVNNAPFVNTTPGTTVGTAAVTCVITEPIFLSPFLFGKGSTSKNGFIGVQTMDFQFVLSNALSRIWSHDNSGGTVLSNITVNFGQPALLFNYITPKLLEPIPSALSYSYMVVDRYPTDNNSSVAPNTSVTIESNNIQLNSIPRRVYIYARKRNADLTFTDTDTFFALNSVSIQYNNQSGLLSSATAQDLYNISKRNGVNLSWAEYSGGAYSTAIITAPPTISNQGVPVTFNSLGTQGAIPTGLVGSVLCLDLGIDIGLDSLHASGEIFTSQFQIKCNFTNINQTQSIIPTLYLVFISEGIWTIENLNSIAQIGVLSKTDILNAHQQPPINYKATNNVYGGDFLADLRRFGHKLMHGLKTAAPYLKTAADVAVKAAPFVLPLVGLGEDHAGVLVGGRREKMRRGGELIGRNELQHRLNQY